MQLTVGVELGVAVLAACGVCVFIGAQLAGLGKVRTNSQVSTMP